MGQTDTELTRRKVVNIMSMANAALVSPVSVHVAAATGMLDPTTYTVVDCGRMVQKYRVAQETVAC